MFIFQSVPLRFDLIYLLFYADCLVDMNVIFISANQAIVRLGLILWTILIFAEIHCFVPPARALRHHFYEEVVSY